MSNVTSTIVAKPHAASPSPDSYRFNRPPLQASFLAKLPLGAIRPSGWLKHQLDLMIVGMTGQLQTLSSHLAPNNGWLGGDNQGWEEQVYWLRGFYPLAVLTQHPGLLAEAHRWIEAIIQGQDSDGYFGPRRLKHIVGKNGQEVCDLWPHMLMMDTFIEYHEQTSDKRIPDLMARFFSFCAAVPDARFIPVLKEGFGDWKPEIQRDRAGDMLSAIFWLYNQTGDGALLNLADRFYRRIAPPLNEWLDNHVVHFTQRFRYPAEYSLRSKQLSHFLTTDYWYHQHMSTWGQQPRGIFGADERIRSGYTDPRQGFETCGMTEFNKSFYSLGRMTGDVLYADRCEDITLNHFPAAQTPDLKGLHYLTASNQSQLDKGDHDFYNKGMQLAYSPHTYRCCQHNAGMGWPWYVENLWQATPDDGLAAWLYAGCDVTTRAGKENIPITIKEETEYPFTGHVELTLNPHRPVSFPLYLRIPGWCREFRVSLNHQRLESWDHPGCYLRLDRHWASGDTLSIDMGMALQATVWPKTGAVTIDRGPLSYSVKIGERWQVCGGTDQWPEWEVLPTTPWNYGLVINPEKPEENLSVTTKSRIEAQPWTVEAAPVEIKAKAKRIPQWGMRIMQTVDPLQPGPIYSAEPTEDITLIPLGCARLRISCLPVVSEDTTLPQWE